MKRNINPPRLAPRFLARFCPDHLLEEIEGDLMQRFHRDMKHVGEKRARVNFFFNTIRFFRPGIIMRNKTSISFTPMYMFANYFKVASRVMLRNKAYAAINIAGLAMGITGAILLFLWIEKEFSYDRFHADKDRIYAAWNRETDQGGIKCWSTTPRILAPTLVQEYPGIESAISYGTYNSSQLFTVGETRLVKTSGAYTDPQFLTMFSFPLLKGNPSSALSDPTSIVLTEDFAKQIFGSKEPFGETVTVGESGYNFEFKVTGILKNLPSNTDFHFDYLISWGFLESIGEKDSYWGNNSVNTYVKLQPGENVDQFNEKVKNVAKKHSRKESTLEIFLYPLTKMRLYSKFENGIPSGGRIEIIRMLGILGICLIVIACINFINLSTARAQKRSKEVGIRKVTGAHRYALVVQFLCEAMLVAATSAVISIAVAYLVLPSFSNLIQQPLALDFGHVTFWVIVVAFIGFVGILAGGYPAFYLSSFEPVRILKGATVTYGNRNGFRRLLVILQFGFAITMIISVIVISRQIEFVQNRDTGYAKNNLIYHAITGEIEKNYQAYKHELISSGVATSVTKTSSAITERMSNTDAMRWKGKDPQNKTIIERFYIDEGFSATTGVTILEGRDMDLQQYPSDSTAALLNETAAKLMGFEDPVGETIVDGNIEWHVIGVIKDFVLTSPYQKIEPTVFMGSKGWFHVIHIRLNPDHPVQQNMASITTLFKKFNPSYPFEYHFVDEAYQRKFAGLEKTLTITSLFGSMAIFIACLGLLGLSTFIIETRVKEIGIRKVLGCSISNIIKLLCIDSLKPIVVAIIFFSPLAWLSMKWWLQYFDYRISLSAGIFLFAGAAILLIALMTIILQTFRAASANPVKTLRTE
jgi:putative ABC transport system permease protein